MGEAITRHSLRPLRFAEGECDQDPDAIRGAGTLKHVLEICINFPLVIARESGQSSTPTPVGSGTGVSGVSGDDDVRTAPQVSETVSTPRGYCPGTCRCRPAAPRLRGAAPPMR
jgi:hypothetical protein